MVGFLWYRSEISDNRISLAADSHSFNTTLRSHSCTTDTYTAEQTQEEFFYQLPFELMDLLWYAFENKYDWLSELHVSSE